MTKTRVMLGLGVIIVIAVGLVLLGQLGHVHTIWFDTSPQQVLTR